MLRRLVTATFLIVTIAFGGHARAVVVSYQGSLSDPDQVFFIEFSLSDPSTLSIQGFGYGGGVNGSGSPIASGGFDTVISLFSGVGASAVLIDSNDDGTCPAGSADPVTGGCLDSTLFRDLLLPGQYVIAVSASFNVSVGPTLGDGFSGGGSFTDVFGDVRTANYAIDLSVGSLSAVPEPSTLALLLAPMALIFVSRGRRARGSRPIPLNRSALGCDISSV